LESIQSSIAVAAAAVAVAAVAVAVAVAALRDWAAENQSPPNTQRLVHQVKRQSQRMHSPSLLTSADAVRLGLSYCDVVCSYCYDDFFVLASNANETGLGLPAVKELLHY